MTRGFENSAGAPLAPDAVLECGVCWWTFDPAVGDPEVDLPPGVAFADLPDDWRCPSCDNDKSKFMVRDGGTARAAPVVDTSLEARVGALTAAYRAAEPSMVGLPVHNDQLAVEAVGFRAFGSHYAGVIITPWCMNIAVIPMDPASAEAGVIGSKRAHVFPSGGYTFVMGRMDGVGAVETCSLFSPMDEFDDPDVARVTAQSAVDGLFTEPERPSQEGPKVTRRFLFTRNGAPA